MSLLTPEASVSDCSPDSTEDHLLSVFEPFVQSLDQSIDSCLSHQTQLSAQLDSLVSALNAIKSSPDLSAVIEDKTKRLVALKRRLTLIHTIVQNANDRTRKLIASHKVNEQNKIWIPKSHWNENRKICQMTHL